MKKTITQKASKKKREVVGKKVVKCQRCVNCGKEPGCRACGNPAYPECKTDCPMFDD